MSRSITTTNRADRLVEAHERLTEAVAGLTSGEDWQAMLDVAKRFHRYSPNNLWLIYAQRPSAIKVAGYRSWQSLGRHVRPGEHGIAILAPCIYKNAPTSASATESANDSGGSSARSAAERPGQPRPTGDSANARVLRGFRVVHVFDLAQTDGDDLPEVAPAALTGDAPAELWERLASRLTSTGFRLLRGDTGSANATTHFLTRTVVVRSDLSPAQAVKSLAHEVAHTMLHDGTEYSSGCRGTAEIEAESVAYLVCGAAGVDTGEYSFPYVARWADGDVELVRHTTERVVSCARWLIEALGLEQVDLATEAP